MIKISNSYTLYTCLPKQTLDKKHVFVKGMKGKRKKNIKGFYTNISLDKGHRK